MEYVCEHASMCVCVCVFGVGEGRQRKTPNM